MPDWKIEVGDLVKVNCENAQTTIAFEATVLNLPTGPGDTWHFQRNDGTLIYTSENITIYLLAKGENTEQYYRKQQEKMPF